MRKCERGHSAQPIEARDLACPVLNRADYRLRVMVSGSVFGLTCSTPEPLQAVANIPGSLIPCNYLVHILCMRSVC